MRWLIVNDISIEKKSFFFYLILIIGERLLNVNLPIDFLNGVFYFYSIAIVLYNDLGNNAVFFYTLFPRKRYFLICQKNLTFVIFAFFYNIISGIVISRTLQEIFKITLRFWTIGSLLLLFFCQFKLSYAESTLQIILYFIGIVYFCGFKYIQGIEINDIMLIIFIGVINITNIFFYRKKDFSTNFFIS